MTSIYDQYRASFAQVSGYVVARDGERVATIGIKFPRDGAGRLYAYAHWIGVPMVRGFAGGYGYDKVSAALASAARRIPDLDMGTYPDGTPYHDSATREAFAKFREAIGRDSGSAWERELRDAGFTVWQAI